MGKQSVFLVISALIHFWAVFFYRRILQVMTMTSMTMTGVSLVRIEVKTIVSCLKEDGVDDACTKRTRTRLGAKSGRTATATIAAIMEIVITQVAPSPPHPLLPILNRFPASRQPVRAMT